MTAIDGKSPITGETVDGEALKQDYEIIKNELMQIMRSHKLTAGQAKKLLELCRNEIDITIHQNCF